MSKEVSMGGMWPRIYNLTEKSLSARGQMWTLGTSSSFSCLALRWAESHLSTFARERMVFITQKTRGAWSLPHHSSSSALDLPSDPVTLVSSPFNLAPVSPVSSLLAAFTHQPLRGSSMYMSGRNKA